LSREAGLEQATDDPFLVVGRDVDGDKALVSELQRPIAGPVGTPAWIHAAANDPRQTAEASLALLAVIVVPRPEERQKEHGGRGQVVLERVGEEERAHPQRDQRQLYP